MLADQQREGLAHKLQVACGGMQRCHHAAQQRRVAGMHDSLSGQFHGFAMLKSWPMGTLFPLWQHLGSFHTLYEHGSTSFPQAVG